MQVRVRLFAALRERAGWSERSLELGPDARIGDVWAALGMGDEPPGIAYARNREYAGRGVALADGDEVALIPPVSGGAFRLVEGPLDVDAVIREAGDPEAGAIASFVGTTRRRNRGRTVVRLRYEAYDGMAESEMARIAADVSARHGLTRVAMAHRTGEVPVGEASVVIAVSAPHRAPALAACAEAIDALKQTVPIWKKELFEGGEEWIGHQGSNPSERGDASLRRTETGQS
jgi:MoaE-MoaD fusion protein